MSADPNATVVATDDAVTGSRRSVPTLLVLNVITIFLGLGLWWALSAAGLKLPTPWSVLVRMVQLIADGTLLVDIAASLSRVLTGFVLGTLVAIPVGVLAAIKRYSWFDYSAMLGSTLGVAVPNYWIGLMAIIFFSVQVNWLPTYGADSWKSYILPVIVLSIEEMAAGEWMERS